MSSYERGRRGAYGGGGSSGSSRDDQDRERKRHHGESDRGDGKFSRGRGGRGRGRGGGAGRNKRNDSDFPDVITTRPSDLIHKTAQIGDGGTNNDKIVKLTTNYFKIDQNKKVSMFMYSVEFEPYVEMKGMRYELMRSLSDQLGLHVYDGTASTYLLSKLQQRINVYDAIFRDRHFVIKLTEKREILYTDGMFFTILNIILRRCFDALSLNEVMRNFYDAKAAIKIDALRLELWPGYKSSIRQHENDVLVCVDLTHKVMRNETIWNMISDCARNSHGDYRYKAEKLIIGVTVLTFYNNKTYQITGIDWNQKVTVTFDNKGVPKTFIDYYRERYGIHDLDPNQPLLVYKSKDKDLRRGSKDDKNRLVPQLCKPTGITDSMRLNFHQMKDLANYTRMTPQDRIQRLITLNNRLHEEKPNRIFQENQLTLRRDLVQVDGRQLCPENIIFGNNVREQAIDPRGKDGVNWTHHLKSNVMYKSMTLTNWVVICPSSVRADTEHFIDLLIKTGTKMGMKINNFQKKYLSDGRNISYSTAIRECQAKDVQFVMVIIEGKKSDLYAAVKRQCFCSNQGSLIPSQVIVSKTIDRSKGSSLVSIATKVAIQINCKLGGIPWQIHIPLSDLLVIGFDITKDASNRKSDTYSAMVAHLNPKSDDGGKFYSQVCHHSRGDSISDNFAINVMGALNQFRSIYGTLPRKIIIYRDGVGDGQIEHVNNAEMKTIEQKLDYMYNFDPYSEENRPYGYTFVIINKRINTRLFIKGSSGRASNPLAGTVVDSVITLPERYDFYLISQNVTQGTVSPTSYNIIKDTSDLNAAQLQKLSYKLCHTYYNWSGTTRVPAVVQYAKKLALLAGQHLQQRVRDRDMSDEKMLYFL